MNESRAAERPPAPPPVRRTVPVIRSEQISRHIRRITFGGPEMEGFGVGGPAEHMKIYFPKAGEELPFIPETRIEGQPRPLSRTYTPRRWRPETLELDIDFVLHGDGPGADWAANAQPGKLATLSTPKSAYAIDPNVERYVIAGDDAAVPAIGTILEALPVSAQADVYLEVEGPDDEQRLSSRAAVQLNWLHRGEGTTVLPGSLIQQTVRDLPLPDGGRVFVACEASIMRDIRRYLLNERQVDRTRVYTHGYWKAGEANHPDGDRGQEI
jgi:NADPH-dependent ferric siderophore reductase